MVAKKIKKLAPASSLFEPGGQDAVNNFLNVFNLKIFNP